MDRRASTSPSRAAASRADRAEFDGWAPELTALITDGETAPVPPPPLHALPIGHRWDRVPGVTLLGDAAHLMPPNGEGANLAMFDGAELGKAIAAHPDDVEAALTAYEQALFPRSAAAAAEADRNLKLFFDDNALVALLTFSPITSPANSCQTRQQIVPWRDGIPGWPEGRNRPRKGP